MKKILSEYQVGIGDINYGGHMGNDKALQVFHDARIIFLRKLGYTELNMGDDVAVIIVEANVKYKREVFLHDVLETEVGVSKISFRKTSCLYLTFASIIITTIPLPIFNSEYPNCFKKLIRASWKICNALSLPICSP